MKPLAALLFLALVLPASGCGRLEPAVRPYERSQLNDPVMDPERDPVAANYMRRVLACGEGARGGNGQALPSRSCY